MWSSLLITCTFNLGTILPDYMIDANTIRLHRHQLKEALLKDEILYLTIKDYGKLRINVSRCTISF